MSRMLAVYPRSLSMSVLNWRATGNIFGRMNIYEIHYGRVGKLWNATGWIEILKIAINYRKFVRPQVVNVDDRSEIVLWSENHIGKCSIEARWKSKLGHCTSEGSCRCESDWMTTSLCKRSRIKSPALWLMMARNRMGCEQWLDSLTT